MTMRIRKKEAVMTNTFCKVLFLEDEPTIREVLTEYMVISGYQVTSVPNGDEAIALINSDKYDIAILDIMVPGADGFDVLAHIRNIRPEMAVIMLTALDDDQTQIKAFNHYADDYVIKPVSPIILLKRMETILRRTVSAAPLSQADHSGLVLNEESYCALYNGQCLPLTLSEYLLLQTLYRRPNQVYTREQLILNIFNEDYIGNDRIIDAHVKNLRKKLPVPCIKTVIGVGYQFDLDALKKKEDGK